MTKASQEKLSEQQLAAIALLSEGRTDAEVAEELGVEGVTVSTWRRDPYFAAELNRRRQSVWWSAHDGIRALITDAVDTLRDAVRDGDVRASVEVLKATGLYGKVGPPVGEVEPDLVIIRQAQAWADTELAKSDCGDVLETLLSEQRRPELVRQRLAELRETTE